MGDSSGNDETPSIIEPELVGEPKPNAHMRIACPKRTPESLECPRAPAPAPSLLCFFPFSHDFPSDRVLVLRERRIGDHGESGRDHRIPEL